MLYFKVDFFEILCFERKKTMKKQFGKKAVVLTLVGLMAATTLAGCGDKKENSATKVIEYDINDYVKLGAYTGLDVVESITNVTDDDVQYYLDTMVDNAITYNEITDRNVIEGDRITIDYTRTVEGEEDQTQSDFVLKLGNGSMPDAFEEKMIGLNTEGSLGFTIDEEVSTDSVDEEGNTTTETKTVSAHYEVTLKKIEEEIVPELTDEFVAENSDYDTIEAYKDAKRAELEESNAESAKSTAQSELLNMIVEASEISGTPAFVYNMNYNSICQSYTTYASYFGYDLETYMSAAGVTYDDLKTDAVEMTKQTLVIEAICKSANIDITDEQFDENLEMYVTDYGYESKDAVLEAFTHEELLFDMRRDAAIEYIYENNNVTQEYVDAES